ncbi:alpha/beta hydrolase [Mycolicibacterium vinylchloridicum]|uniref:alpha/beta hydrolase n=1 Tax=Mycolicibacterium vinylchloridicum TaxID=2736928 RepID=UPI0015CBFCD3|nr:alpha/beta fold hydrolase [Mycolicibacterium vinylchloridicum]
MTEYTVTRDDLTFSVGDSTCAGWIHLPRGVERPPVVVLGHGLGATREMGLDAYAERFARAGIAALSFTYRHFGDSGGQPRQLLSIRRQLADWDAALDYVRSRSDIDPGRVAVWGTSFGGGHALTIASRHPELRAAVAQCPFTDGLASARALGLRSTARALPSVMGDLLAAARGRQPVTIALAAPPGELGLMNAPDALTGTLALVPPGITFINEVAARVLPTITAYRPGRSVKRVRPPILFCVTDGDSVTPAAQTLAYARTAPHGEIKRYDAGHFDIYQGEPFDAVVADQVEFLTRHLQATDPSAAGNPSMTADSTQENQ